MTCLIDGEDIRAAAKRIDGSISRTPFLLSQTLSELTGAEIWLKFENLQFTASFKERGALNRLLTLEADERQRGVVAVSAGNHAQGVALHARRLGIPATIVMPASTPRIKVARTEAHGAQVILAGEDFAEALKLIPPMVQHHGLTFIHPFDDPIVIAGQGTVGLEMIHDGPALDAVVVAVGGGGLISGVSTALRSWSPKTAVIGVQSEAFPSMANATGRYCGKGTGGVSIAEGIAVAVPGRLTLAHVKSRVDDLHVVSEAAIEDSVALLLQIEKTLCEGAGAAGLAAVLAAPNKFKGRRVGLILCGGNIDSRVLISVLQRHLARTGQLVRVNVTAHDRAGPLGAIATIIGACGGNIMHVQHDRIFGLANARATDIGIDLELADPNDLTRIMTELRNAGFNANVVQSSSIPSRSRDPIQAR